MCLIDDDDIKVPDTEPSLAVGGVVIQTHHRRIGGDEYPALFVAVRHQIDRGGIGQVLLEGVDRLIDQRNSVSQEQHSLGPMTAHQQVAQGNDRARLPGSRCQLGGQ